MLLKEFYNETFFYPKDHSTEVVFGAIVNRLNEVPVIESEYKQLVYEYIGLNVKKHLGLTITEYIDLDPAIREIYIVELMKIKEEESKQVESLQDTASELGDMVDEYL